MNHPQLPCFLELEVCSLKKSDPASIGGVLTQLASAIIVAPMPRSGPLSGGISNSPAKTIENQSQCYWQLGEIKMLYESGLLSELEYQSEHEAIMSTLFILILYR